MPKLGLSVMRFDLDVGRTGMEFAGTILEHFRFSPNRENAQSFVFAHLRTENRDVFFLEMPYGERQIDAVRQDERWGVTAAAAIRPQRARGVGRLTAKLVDGRTRLAELFQEGSAKIRLPRTFSPEMEAVIINTSGGLTGGDMMSWSVNAGPGCHVTATTQACEKIYKAAAGTAEVTTRIAVATAARVDWLPQETILFERAALARRLEVELDGDAEFLGLEAVLLGRRAMGEAMESGLFADRWRIRCAGRLVHAEDIRLDGAVASLAAAPGVLSGRVAFATMLYCGRQAETHLAAIRARMGEAFGGASVWNDKLLVRLSAEDGFALRKTLIPLISILRNGAPVPKVWNI